MMFQSLRRDTGSRPAVRPRRAPRGARRRKAARATPPAVVAWSPPGGAPAKARAAGGAVRTPSAAGGMAPGRTGSAERGGGRRPGPVPAAVLAPRPPGRGASAVRLLCGAWLAEGLLPPRYLPHAAKAVLAGARDLPAGQAARREQRRRRLRHARELHCRDLSPLRLQCRGHDGAIVGSPDRQLA